MGGVRVRPHAKLHVSLRHHSKTAVMFADNDMLAMYTRLLLLGIERFAARNDGKFHIHWRELGEISGKHRRDVAEKSLQRLADLTPTCAEPAGDLWEITIPNFAKKQGFKQKKPHVGAAPEVSEVSEVSEEAEVVPDSSNRPVFKPGFWTELLKAHPKERYDISEADILDWWDYIWLVYEATCEGYRHDHPGKRILHQSRVRNWWRRATEAELEEAIEAGRRRRKHPETSRRQAEIDAIKTVELAAEAERRANGSGFSSQFDSMLSGQSEGET